MPRRLPIGAELVDGGVSFRVWAPAVTNVKLVLERPDRREVALRAETGGYFSTHVDGLAAGARYRFRLGDSAELVADPASRFQPDGPFGPSQVVDPADTAWTDGGWRGITDPRRQVVYEMHIGTFTPDGTWAAAAEQLPFLADLGVTTIEMMPVNDFAGRRGWGYDGVNLYAPTRLYGAPADLRRFVDRAHAVGLAVILDVVYNHFGPAGNSLFEFCEHYRHTDLEPNEWGDAINFDGTDSRGVRELFVTNAGYWIDEFHFDGLRIDATQAITDRSRCHVLSQITAAARAAANGRSIFIVGENEPQDVAMIRDHGLDALWNDDFHHTARVALTGATDGYFHDYRGTPQELVSAIKRGFLYQGQLYAWQRNTRGTPTRGLERWRLVHFLENHDQVANLGFGDRLARIANPSALRAMTALLLLAPQIPMLFQGQEHGSARPFRFFCDHDPELATLVRKGRAGFLTQFARLATPEAQAALPDPSAPETFAACVLDPRERDLAAPATRLHRDLLRLRREDPVFTGDGELDGAVLGPHALCIRWWGDTPDGDRLLLVNLGPCLREAVVPEPLLAPPRGQGWTTRWSSEHPDYGGAGTPPPFTPVRLAIPAYAAVLCAPDRGAYLRVDPPPVSGEKAPVEP